MSLGLFTVDDQNHLWFDMDCFLTHPRSFHPKHFVFNLDAGTDGRILLLHTGWLDAVHDAAKALLNQAQPLTQQKVADYVKAAMDTLGPDAEAYARVVYRGHTRWEFISIDKGQNMPTVKAPAQDVHGALYPIGVGVDSARSSWNSTGHMNSPQRLRAALQFAADHRRDVLVPETRQPARIDRCVRPWAHPTELLT